MICNHCGGSTPVLWTWRDPDVQDRYRGHGILEVCAKCLYALSGHDRRGQSVADALAQIEHERRP